MAAPKKKSLKGKPDKSVVASAMGSAGLKQYGGYIFEEFLRDLRGPQGIKKFQEMGANSAVIGSGLAVSRLIASLAEWKVEPFSEEQEDKDVAEFLMSCMDDMEHSWSALVRSAFSMIQFGFAPHEIVLKVRDGKESKHEDGLIGWKALPLRPQDSLKRWEIDPNGRWTAMVQQGQYDLKERTIPRTKLLNFRPRDDKDNPEGTSALRYVYFTYYFCKKFQEIEGIGVERSISGLPVMGIPAEAMADGASADLQAVYTAAKEIVQNVRIDADAGVVMPLSYTEDGHPLYTFALMSASGSSLPDTSKIIERLERRMAQALGTDFMLLGHEGVGSYNLGDSKLDSFEMAVEGYLRLIEEPINQVLIPLTLKVNGLDVSRPPMLKHCPLEKKDLGRLGDYISKMVSAQVIEVDEDLESWVREQGDLPPRNPSQPAREKPLPATNTKPFGGAPDKGKPGEEGRPPRDEPTKRPVRPEQGDGGEMVSESEVALLNTVGVLGAALAERASQPLQVNVLPTPVQITNEVQTPDVFVDAPTVNVDVKPTPVKIENKVPQAAAPIVRVEAKAAPAEGVQKIQVVSLPEPPDTITTVEKRDKEGRVEYTRRKALKK